MTKETLFWMEIQTQAKELESRQDALRQAIAAMAAGKPATAEHFLKIAKGEE